MIPKDKEGWAAVVVAVLLQIGLLLSISTPEGVQGWAAFGVVVLLAAIAPQEVIAQVKQRILKTSLKGDGK